MVAAHYNQVNKDGSSVLYVFAHTRGTPPQWYDRTRTTLIPGTGAWSAWTSLDIASIHLLPVIWDRRLHLFSPVFHAQSEKSQDRGIPAQGGQGQTAKAAQKYWSVEFAISELSAGQWQPKRTIAERMYFSKTSPTYTSTGPALIDRPAQAFTFTASQDNTMTLQNRVYSGYSQIEYANATWSGSGDPDNPVDIDGVVLGPNSLNALGAVSMPDAPMAVTEDSRRLSNVSLVDLSQEPTYPLVPSANPLVPPSSQPNYRAVPYQYNFSGQELVAGFYDLPATGAVPLIVLCQSTAGGLATNVTLPNKIVNPRIVIR